MNELEWDQIPLKSGASGIEDFWKKSQIKSRKKIEKKIEYFFLFFVFFDFPQNEGFQESSLLRTYLRSCDDLIRNSELSPATEARCVRADQNESSALLLMKQLKSPEFAQIST